MPRPPRVEYSGAFYHVISRGNHQQVIFHNELDYQQFLKVLFSVINRYDFHLYAYVLMPNHFHLLIEQEKFPLSRLMQILLTSYARWHNVRYQQIGHLFQGRYRAILCDKDSYLLELTRYIHLNPVRANIVKHPYNYPWSSYRAYLGKAPSGGVETALVLAMLAKREASSRRAYERFVLDAVGERRRPEFYNATEKIFLGDDRFVAEGKRRSRSPLELQSKSQKKATIKMILETVAQQSGLLVPVIIGRTEGEAEKRAREVVVGVARQCSGLSLSEIALALNRKPNTISVLAKQLVNHLHQPPTRKLLQQSIKSII